MEMVPTTLDSGCLSVRSAPCYSFCFRRSPGFYSRPKKQNARLVHAVSFQGMRLSTSRREFFLITTSIPFLFANEAQGEENSLSLERYCDEKEGFTLLKPSNWKKVDKAGAYVLFEDPNAKTNNIGVVVNPVRISSLKDFDSPQNIGDRLLEAERKKPGTNSVSLIQVKERITHEKIPIYEFEYFLDSTRGLKRVLAAVTVASSKLYLLNIAYADNPVRPIAPHTRMMLENILHSFDIVN